MTFDCAKSQDLTTEVQSTLHVIIPLDGETCTASATDNLWVGVSPFSNRSYGNEVTPYTTGKAYFSALKSAILGAKTSIYIIGWQVNWDVQLDEQGTRLYDVLWKTLNDTAHPDLKVYILPWDDSAPIQTYDDQTKAVLESLNEKFSKPRVFVCLTNSLADADAAFFSHHQKQVVIDEDTAFVGGMDLAYGRFCDKHYDLKADAEGREVLNRYNSCICATQELKKDEVVNPDTLTAEVKKAIGQKDKKIHQVPYEDQMPYETMFSLTPSYKTLDPDTQPRMPWQDVQVKIKGPAAADLALNFVLRWNTEAAKAVRAPDGTILTTCSTPPLKVPDSSTILPEKSEGCGVQVLRSASRNMCTKEYDFLAPKDQKRFRKPLAAQANIASAMETLISKAEHFIYIENQFFISAFGEPDIPATKDDLVGPAQQIKEDFGWLKRDATRIMPGDADDPPENRICALLAKRIDETIFASHPFHVYITLPVHPEGGLNTAIIANQVHWTMQTLTNGSFSLLNRIRRSLLAKKLKDNNDPDWARAYKLDIKKAESAFKENGIEFKQCFDYVTLLNLRNWKKLDSDKGVRYVTEQIYPHNKMMIVDDRYVLLGTANINDRSLLGYRDSEINVLIKDTKTGQADLCGDGTKRLVRNFARQLRMEVWNKIFGITAGGDRAASQLKDAVEKPAAPASWKKIQEIAEANTKLYEAAFDFIPRNDDVFGSVDKRSGNPLPASIWPTRARNPKNQGAHIKTMPFQEKFWTEKRFNAEAAGDLENVKGFITLLPYKWTQGENNNIGLHTHTVAVNTVTPPQQDAVRMAENAPALESSSGKA